MDGFLNRLNPFKKNIAQLFALLPILLVLIAIPLTLALLKNKQNIGSFAISPNPSFEWVNGVSAEGYCNSGFQCDLSNTLAKDGKETGLSYSNTGQICRINGTAVSSCATVSLGTAYDISQVEVNYKMVDSICGDTCSGIYCGTNPGGVVFLSPDQLNWTKIGTLNYTTAPTTQTFNTSSTAKYLRVCRGGGGEARSNLAVDNIAALVLTNDTTPTPTLASTPIGEKDALLAVCNSLTVSAQPYCRQFVEKDYGLNNGLGYIDNYLFYPWSESYILMAYTRMYRTTQNTLYLDKLIRHIDVILANRDDKVGRKDYRGISAAGWLGDEKYTTPGMPMRFVAHSGMIISGMVDFVRIIYSDEKLWPTYKQKAGEYLQAAREVVAAHDAEWKENELINSTSVEGYCNGFQCNLGNALAKDGKEAGLFRSSSGGQICYINGTAVTSCVTASLGTAYDASQVEVSYRMVDSICGDTCSGVYCGTNPGGIVFASPDQQNWTKIGTLNYSTTSTTQTFNISGATKYLRVCRGGGGEARSNLAIDNISNKQPISSITVGHYYFPDDAPVTTGKGSPVPINQEAVMGVNLLYLFDLTGDQNYLSKATKMTQSFKNNVSLAGTGYTWLYWPGIISTVEDISHGNLDLWLAKAAYEHNIVFESTDMNRFAETFLKKIYNGSATSINTYINGTSPDSSSSWLIATGRGWIDLNAFSNNAILPIVKSYYDGVGLSNIPFSSGAPGLAALTDLLTQAR